MEDVLASLMFGNKDHNHHIDISKLKMYAINFNYVSLFILFQLT